MRAHIYTVRGMEEGTYAAGWSTLSVADCTCSSRGQCLACGMHQPTSLGCPRPDSEHAGRYLSEAQGCSYCTVSGVRTAGRDATVVPQSCATAVPPGCIRQLPAHSQHQAMCVGQQAAARNHTIGSTCALHRQHPPHTRAHTPARTATANQP